MKVLRGALFLILGGWSISFQAAAQGGTGGGQGAPVIVPKNAAPSGTTGTSSHTAGGKSSGAANRAASGDTVFHQIEKLERDRAAAVVNGDVDALERETSDGAIFIDRNGRARDKTETIAALKSGDIKLTANDLSDLEVRAYGDTAVITGKSYAKGTIDGKELTGPMRFMRVYVKKDGRWQSVAFQQTPIIP